MGNLVITPAGGSAVTFLPATSGFYRAAGKYWVKGHAQDPEYAREMIAAPGVDGYIVRRHGARGREFEGFAVEYVSMTKALTLAALLADVTALKNKNCSVAVPDDATYANCEIIGIKKVNGIPRDTSCSTFRLKCMLQIRQVR